MVAARRALGRGYLRVPSVGIFGLVIWFLDCVIMECVEKGVKLNFWRWNEIRD